MNFTYTQLTNEQIKKLEGFGCYANNWSDVLVTPNTDINYLRKVRFSGKNYIGSITGERISFGGVARKNGIYNAHLHNCKVGANPFIRNIENYIANYDIGDNVVIENVDIIATEKGATFGNGVMVAPINETGGRSFPIFDGLTAQIAYILSMYRHKEGVLKNLEEMINYHIENVRSDNGFIGNNVKIKKSRTIKNVNIGEYSILEGVARLDNGTINSYKDAPVYIGHEVMASNFIISSDSVVDNASLITNCFVGEGCILDKHYSADNSVFFANSQGFNGEACAIFAGPFTVTHHKSTLLIAGMFSFMNAGSGSNQSNHMYKLGPIHQGILERGSKTTSDSYLLWPSKVGAFTLVMGRHYQNTDSSDLPFSYLIENKDESVLVPAINLRSVGTVRDAQKWPTRDRRHPEHRSDCVNFNLLSPFTVNKMYRGLKVLKNIEELAGTNVSEYSYHNMKIRKSALVKGKVLYEMGIYKFLGNSVISRLNTKELTTTEELRAVLMPNEKYGGDRWIDIAGLICPAESLKKLLSNIEDKQLYTIEKLQKAFAHIHERYYDLEWTWAAWLLEEMTKKTIKELTPKDIIKLIEKWKTSVVKLDKMLYEDAKKEFSLSTQISFGVDGDAKIREEDFKRVRGDFDTNDTVKSILAHIKKKSKLGDRAIDEMNKIIEKEK